MTTIARTAIVLALILAIALGVQTYRLNKARDLDVAARAAAQGKTLVDAGWLKGVEGSQAMLRATVPKLLAELAAAKKAKATVGIASHWEGSGKAVAVPCNVVMGPPAGNIDSRSASAPNTDESGGPPSVAVTPHVRIDDAVALDDLGGIFVARKVHARLSVGESWASGWEDIAADPGSTTKVAPELTAAWKAYKNPPYRLEAFVGASLGSDGAGIVGGVAGGKGRIGWFAMGDYNLSDAGRSRVSGGGRFTLKR
jgi:hypothetical protein